MGNRDAFHRAILQRRHQKRALKRARILAARRRGTTGRSSKPLTLPHEYVSILCPSVLDFDVDPVGTAQFFRDLEGILDKHGKAGVTLDHRPLTNLSPGAALVLIAHIYRASRRRRPLNLKAHFPADPASRELLGLIGYYRYFTGFNWKPSGGTTRYFLAHMSGQRVAPENVKQLCEHWKASGNIATQKIYEALMEGMANAVEWAYLGQPDYRLWWMLGYRDAKTGEIAYSFYDQGAGIPATIRRKKRFIEHLPGLGPTDSQLIIRGVLEGRYSRSLQKGRGTGLPRLLDFVRSGADGELLIFSSRSRCVFKRAKPPIGDDYGIGLRGTLISWSFQPQ